jgi:hypothetical protein
MKKARWTLLLVLVFAVTGCSSLSEHSPTGPADTGSATTSSDSYAEAFILAAQGGTVVLGANSIHFPPNALAEDTLISITRAAESTPYVLIFDLYPHGIQFQKPVTLTLEMGRRGIMAHNQFSLPQIYWYNEDSSQWQGIGGRADYGRRVIVTDLNHFSRYATARPTHG